MAMAKLIFRLFPSFRFTARVGIVGDVEENSGQFLQTLLVNVETTLIEAKPSVHKKLFRRIHEMEQNDKKDEFTQERMF